MLYVLVVCIYYASPSQKIILPAFEWSEKVGKSIFLIGRGENKKTIIIKGHHLSSFSE